MSNCVSGIGNPILDIIVNVSDEQLAALGYAKGSMTLISDEQSKSIMALVESMNKELQLGGSAANTLSGVNLLGNEAVYMGRIGDDEYGRMYSGKTAEEGVLAYLEMHDNMLTGHSYILITPDGERTMATHLGASLAFEKAHVNEDKIAKSRILHIEAYQLEDPRLAEAILHAVAIAKKHGAKVSIDLSDAGLIRRNKELFHQVVRDHVDILFANEAEAFEFTGKHEREALDELAALCDVAVVKLGSRGSLIKSAGQVVEVKPHAVEMVNTNGAGDMYAAGILHGLVNDLDMETAGRIASHVSALVVASPGARLDAKHLPEIELYKNN